jgi:periodic tryptophan protein 1
MVLSRDLDLGKIFNAQFGPDPEVAMRVAVAGSAGGVKIWDLSTSNAARKAFGVGSQPRESVEEGKVVGLTEVDDEDDDEGDDEGKDEASWENMDEN